MGYLSSIGLPYLTLDKPGVGLQITTDLNAAIALDFIRVCQDGGEQVGWQNIETSQGVYNSTAVAKMDGYVNYADGKDAGFIYCFNRVPAWAAVGGTTTNIPSDRAYIESYLSWLWTRYGSKITAIECGNEVNNVGAFTGTVADLVTWSTWIYEWCKANTTWTVISPSYTDVTGVDNMEEYLDAGGAEVCDVVGFHPYAGPDPGLRFASVTALAYVAAATARAPGKPIWCTEFGDSTPTSAEVTLAVNYMHQLGVRMVLIYAWDEQGVPDMKINAFGLSTWNALHAALTA